MSDELITTEDLARKLGRAEITVREWVKNGIIRGYRLPGSNLVFIKMSDLKLSLVPYETKDQHK